MDLAQAMPLVELAHRQPLADGRVLLSMRLAPR
jgi:hypothetical protein